MQLQNQPALKLIVSCYILQKNTRTIVSIVSVLLKVKSRIKNEIISRWMNTREWRRMLKPSFVSFEVLGTCN
jgi:hypothetical protein